MRSRGRIGWARLGCEQADAEDDEQPRLATLLKNHVIVAARSAGLHIQNRSSTSCRTLAAVALLVVTGIANAAFLTDWRQIPNTAYERSRGR
jgi:hypothetical protein